jgi:hypothetical protein
VGASSLYQNGAYRGAHWTAASDNDAHTGAVRGISGETGRE